MCFYFLLNSLSVPLKEFYHISILTTDEAVKGQYRHVQQGMESEC